MELPAPLATPPPGADPSTVGGLLIVLAAALAGLWFLRLLFSGARLILVATVALVRLVLSRVFMLLLAVALLAALLAGNVGLADGPWPQHDPPIARAQQDEHIKGTPEYRQQLRQGKRTSTWDDPTEADPLTREAWRKGAAVRGRPMMRDWDGGRRVGADPQGRSLTHIRVTRDDRGRIYGWPSR